jgi:GntR family transcriptional regulator
VPRAAAAPLAPRAKPWLVAPPSGHGRPHHSDEYGQADAGRDGDAAPALAVTRVVPCLLDQRFDLVALRPEGARWCSPHALLDHHNKTKITSIMFAVNIDQADPLDLHAQVAAEIRRAIVEGEARPGERLPAARDLAAVIGVNTNTVLRALRVLRDEGLLEFRRGRGITVTGTPDRTAVLTQAKALLALGRKHGYARDELIDIIQSIA